MRVGCKKGCLCGDINKEYCCLECDKFNTCAEPCMPLLSGETRKEYIIEVCNNAFKVDELKRR